MSTRPDPATLAGRLRRARLLSGLEQAELARRMGIARTSVSNYECGRTEPPASTFVRWAAVTGVQLDWLARGVEQQADDPLELSA